MQVWKDPPETIAQQLATGSYLPRQLIRDGDPPPERLIDILAALRRNYCRDEHSRGVATELDYHLRLRMQNRMLSSQRRLTQVGWVLAAVGILATAVFGVLPFVV